MNRTAEKRRILLLGDARQVHLRRWGSHLLDNGYDVLTASLEPVDGMAGAKERISVPGLVPHFLRYPMAVPRVRRMIHRFRPAIINAHFLPNYGIMAALCGFTPWVLSTWGSDIMLLPTRSALHMRRTRFVISKATHITSDAEVMSESRG